MNYIYNPNKYIINWKGHGSLNQFETIKCANLGFLAYVQQYIPQPTMKSDNERTKWPMLYQAQDTWSQENNSRHVNTVYTQPDETSSVFKSHGTKTLPLGVSSERLRSAILPLLLLGPLSQKYGAQSLCAINNKQISDQHNLN